MKKSVLSLALVAAMGATFVACNDNNGRQVENPAGDAEVRIGMSVFSGKSAQNAPAQYAPAKDVYFDGTNTVGIDHIFVVPMKDNVTQKPVQLADLTTGTGSPEPTTLTVNAETNRFLVYANLRKTIVNGANFDTRTTFGIDINDDTQKSDLTGYYKPHKVYLFADANKNFKVAYNENWSNVTDWSDYTEGTQLGSEAGQMNCIKIENVTYAVGTLAAAVYHGNYTDKKVYVGEDTEGVDLSVDWLTQNVVFVGITVDKQYPEFNYLFAPTGNFISIFETVSGSSAEIKDNESEKMSFANAATVANTFIPVAPFDGGDVVVNVVCRNNNANPIVFGGDGTQSTKIGAGERFYLAAKLSPGTIDGSKSFVFEKGYTTLLNATITNWEKATTTPQTSVDVQIGIEVDLTWKEGVVYDEEI